MPGEGEGSRSPFHRDHCPSDQAPKAQSFSPRTPAKTKERLRAVARSVLILAQRIVPQSRPLIVEMSIKSSANGITTAGPIWSIATKCCDPLLIRELTDASSKYLEFAQIPSKPSNPFVRPGSLVTSFHMLLGGGAFVTPATIHRHIEAVAKVEIDFKERVKSGDVLISGVEWEPRRADHPVTFSRHWAEALSFDWVENTARIKNVLFINLSCSMRASTRAIRTLRSIELLTASPKPQVILDGDIRLTGRAADVLAALWPAYQAHRDRGHSSGDLVYMDAVNLGVAVGVEGESLYRLITRMRADVNQQFQMANGVELPKSALLQTSPRRGYRINPALEIVQSPQPSMGGRANLTTGDPPKRHKPR